MAFPDPRFFRFSGPLAAAEAASVCGAKLVRGKATITTLAESRTGGEGALVFAEKPDQDLPAAAVAIVPEGKGDVVPSAGAVLEARSPKFAFARVAEHLYASRSEEPSGVDDLAAVIDPSADVHPAAAIGADARIGAGAIIGPNAVIGHGVVIGEGCNIGPGASVTHAVLGKRCRIFAGARIGEAGFGYTAGNAGPVRLPQLGKVVLGDEVDVGANTSIDRGTLGDTTIGAMTKIDNLCQIGHNCEVGRGVLIASLTGISGSCKIGDFVMIGGQTGMADHITVGAGAVLAAGTGLMRDVTPGAKVGGRPAKPMRQWMKEIAVLGRLAGENK